VTATVTPVLSLGFCGAKSDARFTYGQGCISTSSDLALLRRRPLKGTAFFALQYTRKLGFNSQKLLFRHEWLW
jgi:hypothetical protein